MNEVDMITAGLVFPLSWVVSGNRPRAYAMDVKYTMITAGLVLVWQEACKEALRRTQAPAPEPAARGR